MRTVFSKSRRRRIYIWLKGPLEKLKKILEKVFKILLFTGAFYLTKVTNFPDVILQISDTVVLLSYNLLKSLDNPFFI